MFSRQFISTFCLFVLVLLTQTSHGQFQDLVRKLPDGANTVLMIDFAKLQDTPLAKQEKWAEQREKLFDAGLEIVPPSATHFLGGAKMQIQGMTPEWQIGLLETSHEPSLPKLAVNFNGTLDRLAERDVAVLPGDVYVVQFGKRFVAMGMPANRQDVDRWLARYDANALGGLSPYLKEAQSYAETSSPIILAIDLRGAIAPSVVKSRLASSAVAEKLNGDLDSLSRAIASIRGMTLGVTVDRTMTGAVKVDFEQDVTALGDAAKPLILKSLSNNGLVLEDLDQWDVSLQGKRIQLTGPLSHSGLRRILSLLDMPPGLYAAHADEEQMGDEEAERQVVIAATQSYFHSVESLLEDLRNDKKGRQTLGQISVWFGKYARKIDRLPMLHVDADMLDYGRLVSTALRTGQVNVTDAAAASRLRQQQVPNQVNVQSYGWYGWSYENNPNETGRQRAIVRSQEQIRGASSANSVIQQLDAATADIRRHMTQKYQVEF
ncbi:hypothetical protein [Blastopirellula retiformator]|uniref:Uncharacterized protein n=1 Tax=Blastopirellula retiformator TaxID=2527970 RepID=A0A5C5UVL7_9BACT|nr:hypothetical protein [Blastopirellula retiformator]TWT29435.1 hypothetical protein Enr8_49510 [Blastopirellula retiformator]